MAVTETSKEGQITRKTYADILGAEIAQGLQEIRRDAGGLVLSGLSAGLDIGFSLFLMAVMMTAVSEELPDGLVKILVANMYAVGFIFVVLGRSELFTEHTSLAVFPAPRHDQSDRHRLVGDRGHRVRRTPPLGRRDRRGAGGRLRAAGGLARGLRPLSSLDDTR